MSLAPYETSIKAIGDAIKGVFDFAVKSKEKQSETEIIREKNKLKKATDIAEKIIILSYKYLDKFVEDDKEKFEDLINEFKKYN